MKKHDSLDYPTTRVALQSEKSPSTALATGRFGLGVAIVYVVGPLAVHINLGHKMIESLVEKGFRQSVLIIVFLDQLMMMMARMLMPVLS